MTIQQLATGLEAFKFQRLLPLCATKTEIGIMTGSLLFNIEGMLGNILQSQLFINSNIWLDENKTQINLPILKQWLTDWLEGIGGTYTYEGYMIDLGFYKQEVFKGLGFTQATVDDLFTNFLGVTNE